MLPMSGANASNRARLILVAIILVMGAYWVGTRYGPRQADKVEAHRATPAAEPAIPAPASAAEKAVSDRSVSLTEEESINVRIYKAASPAVANILTKATEYDFFMD